MLAGVGLYGLLAYRVVRRTAEIGVRIALGATRGNVLWLILREDIVLVLAGIVVGLPVALASARLAQSLLFGLSVTDPLTMAAATATMIGIGTSAGLAPGWRAVRVQPAVVLRHE